jgi:hypothetical protein
MAPLNAEFLRLRDGQRTTTPAVGSANRGWYPSPVDLSHVKAPTEPFMKNAEALPSR